MSAESDDDDDWQAVPPTNSSKRRLNASPKMHQHKKRNLSTEPGTSRTNKYASLSIQMDNEDGSEPDNVEEEGEKSPKPPPIFIPHVADISKMITIISKVIPNSSFNYKSVRNGDIRLVTKSVDSFRKIIKHFESKNISFHTYQVREERAFRVVIKGIHHSTPPEDIKAQLMIAGHQVRYICNAKSRFTKEPLSMFFVDLDPNPNNAEIYKIRHINNAIVNIEPPRKIDELVQCYRCQQFGHTKTYCKKPYRCVKCGLGHPTAECTKQVSSPPQCVHCLQNHTANYKGCKIYKELVMKRNSNNRNQANAPQYRLNRPEYQQRYSTPDNEDARFGNTGFGNRTYAQIAANGNSDNNLDLMRKIEAMVNKQIELTTTLLNMMNMLMTKLCK